MIFLESGKPPLVELRNWSPKSTDSSTLPEKCNEEELSIVSEKRRETKIGTSDDTVDDIAGKNKKGSRKTTVTRTSPVRVYTYKVLIIANN